MLMLHRTLIGLLNDGATIATVHAVRRQEPDCRRDDNPAEQDDAEVSVHGDVLLPWTNNGVAGFWFAARGSLAPQVGKLPENNQVFLNVTLGELGDADLFPRHLIGPEKRFLNLEELLMRLNLPCNVTLLEFCTVHLGKLVHQ